MEMSNTHIFYEDKGVQLGYSIVDNLVFSHAEVYGKFTPSKRKLISGKFEELKDTMRGEGYRTIFAWTPSPKFARNVCGTCDYVGTYYGKELLAWPLD